MSLAVVCLSGVWHHATAAETCRYDGVTNHNGTLAITVDTLPIAHGVRVDVRLVLDAHPFPLMHTLYLMEEISETGPDGIETLAVNDRYRVDGHIVRQSWDVFRRSAAGLDAYRVEGKHAAEFSRQHPAFAHHWDFARFGDAWLQDLPRSDGARRPDLDLRPTSASVRPPLALAFHWLERLGPGAVSVPVFLPGFKERKLVALAIGAAQARSGGTARTAPLIYPDLDPAAVSSVTALLSDRGRMVQLGFDVHGPSWTARATIHPVGCRASP